jgi:putative flippase GtrA
MKVVRFGVVGVFNTLIDFSVLNLLLALFGVTTGWPLVLCNAAAFLAASLNSYLLNKNWTFQQKGRATLRQYLVFLGLAAGGLIINSLVLYLLATGLTRPSWLSPVLWINVAKAAATVASLVWNYLACRYVVFGQNGTRDEGRGTRKS